MSILSTSVTLTWTAPGDDATTGAAIAYDVRYAIFPLSAANWNLAMQVTGEPTPGPPGTLETLTVGGLTPAVLHFFAVRAVDDALNLGPVSNIVQVRDTSNAKVVFMKRADGASPWDVYSTNLDGTGEVSLSGSLAPHSDVSNFAYSPDFNWVAFRMPTGSQPASELYVVPVTGGTPVRISGPMAPGGHASGEFSWSADSTRVLYHADQEADNVFGIWVSSRDGTSSVKISGTLLAWLGVCGAAYRWARDGSRVAFLARTSAGAATELFSARPDGTGLVRVSMALPAGRQVDCFEWAPDGSRIGYRADFEVANVQEIYTSLPDGTGTVKITPLRFTQSLIMFFRWAPDSSLLAYLADQDRPGLWDLYVSRPDGTGNRMISGGTIAGGTAYWPLEWASDSSRVAYLGRRDSLAVAELYASRADGGGTLKLSGPMAAGGNATYYFSWSADGSRIAYLADQSTDGVDELYTSRSDGAANLKVSGPLVNGGQVAGFLWAPDGSRIVYLADQDTDTVSEAYCVLPDGTGRVKISGPMVAGGSVFGGLGWSAGSTRLVYRANQDTLGLYELYSALPDAPQVNMKISGTLGLGGETSSFLADSGTDPP